MNDRLAHALKWHVDLAEIEKKRAEINARKKIRRQLDPDWRNKANNYRRKKAMADPDFRLLLAMRARLACALKGTIKADTTMNLVGCSSLELKQYIESLWRKGMSWSNYGRKTDNWVIDHIRPCASFDLADPEQQRACFHYSNLQPLWWMENARKADSWSP